MDLKPETNGTTRPSRVHSVAFVMKGTKTMAYTINENGRSTIDLPLFAADLARELGGTASAWGDFPNERQQIILGSDRLDVTCGYRDKRVHVRIDAVDVPWNDRDHYARDQKTESASVNPDARPIGRIAADIKKRVIDASQPALAKQRERYAQRLNNRATIDMSRQGLSDIGFDVRPSDDGQQAAIFSGASRHYVHATLYADNTVSIDRLGNMPLETFITIMNLLSPVKPEDADNVA